MGIALKEEHMSDDASAMMSSELWRHCFKKAVFMTCSHSFPYSLVLNVRALTPCILTPSYFLTEHAIKNNHIPTATPSINCHSRRGQPLPPSVLAVKEGETVFVAAGERFRPVFPLAGIEYVPVWFPVFRPDQCIRTEEEEGSPVSDKLKSLHNGVYVETIEVTVQSSDTDDPEEVLFHMAQREHYKSLSAPSEAYFPPKFEAESMFTHTTAVPERLITTANHFYTGTKWDCICL